MIDAPTRRELLIRLIELDLTMTQLARELNVSVQTVSAIIRGQRRSRRVRDYIYTRLGFGDRIPICIKKRKPAVAAAS